MSDWYQVVKTIKGNHYRYLQQTYRKGGRVRTRNRYLGRVDQGTLGGNASPAHTTAPLFQSPSDFGAAMLKQFDAPAWGRDAGEQLLGSAVSRVTTTARGSRNRRPRTRFDFGKDVSYDETAKRHFHLRARRQLRELAGILSLQGGDYDLRSNKGGSAVSEEVTLHADHLYVQVNQSVMGEDMGILFRSCLGRRDFSGGGNYFAPLGLLNDPDELARHITRVIHAGLHRPAQTPVTPTTEGKHAHPPEWERSEGETAPPGTVSPGSAGETPQEIVSYDTIHPQNPTVQSYNSLSAAYDFFNKELFGGTLPPCLITMQRHSKAYGYFAGERFAKTSDPAEITDEIALNPEHFADRKPEEVLSTLAHEMVHLWQHHFGHSPRSGYHSRQWAEKMHQIGLVPTDTGAPGGHETGQRVTHLIDPAGAYARAAAQLLKGNPAILYTDRWRSDDDARRKKAASKTKYTCPGCGLNAWGKPDLSLICSDCHMPLRSVTATPVTTTPPVNQPDTTSHSARNKEELSAGQQAYIKNHPNIQTMDGDQFIPKTIEQLAGDYTTVEAYIAALKTMQQPYEIGHEFYTKYAIKSQEDIEPVLRTIWAQQHPQHHDEERVQERRVSPAGTADTGEAAGEKPAAHTRFRTATAELATQFNFASDVSIDPVRKVLFHQYAHDMLVELAVALDLPNGSYSVYENEGSKHASGEIMLHANHLYVRVSQTNQNSAPEGIMFRCCDSRRDYVGKGADHYVSLHLLNRPDELALHIKSFGLA